MLTIILTRHGEAAPSEIMLGGQLDMSLTPRGRQEAGALARRLAGVRLDRIVSSPMNRALETAQAVATGRPVEVDDRLREFDYGRWEGLTAEETEARDPELRASWDADPAATTAPGGESGATVAARAREFLTEIVAHELGSESEAEDERRVLVVAHGTFNRILLCVALGVPVRDFRRRFVQDRANLTVLRYEQADAPDGAQLLLANDVAHLRGHGEAPWG